jgi:5-methyltetrahydrofolate--homocysteine methyltransferase
MSDFLAELQRRVLVFDGALGTSIQSRDLDLADFDGLDGCNEVLVRTRPDVIGEIHAEFLQVGCDAVETDTFGGAPWVLAEYGLADETESLAAAAAGIAREACDAVTTPERPRWVVGSIGPGTRSPTLSLGNNPTKADFIDYDTMVAGYLRQVRGMVAGGADVLLVETVFDLLQAKAALWACHEGMAAEGRTLPLLVSVTIEKDINTMLLGSEVGAALVALDPLGVDVIGLNCATGPEDMREQVRSLSRTSRLPISVIPNAGIPSMVDGGASYPLTPEALAAAHHEFVRDFGVQLVGGCCGTTPAHLDAVVRALADLRPAPREPEFEPSLTSLYAPVPLEQDLSFLVVGERLNANGSRKFRDLLLDEDWEAMTQMARAQVREGAHTLDVCVDYVGRDGVADMVQVIDRLATQSTLPLMIDSTEMAVVSAALRRIGSRAVINSVNLEDGRRKTDVLLPMAKQFGAAVVVLAIDEEGQARTADRKVEVCKRIAALATDEFGLSASDLIFDTLTFPLGSGQEDLRRDGLATLEAIERVKAEIPGCHTILGVSNVSFGLSPAARQALNSVFLHMAVERGLDAAIVNPAKILPLHQIDDEMRQVCTDLVNDRRVGAGGSTRTEYDPLSELMRLFEGATESRASHADLAALPLTERLQRRIIDGDRDGLDDDLDAAMADGVAPLDIINVHLLAGMKIVGELFGSGQMQLPFVLQSAECMKAAVAHLERFMERADDSGKAKVVLATVKGDVHDIGKNLVDIILTNNGYEVRNLGIKQPIDAIVAAAEDFKADAIGLSGLLVKSTVVMRDDLEELNRRGLARYPVLLGGAALTRAYVEVDLRQLYEGPLFYCRDAFAGLHTMDEVAARKADGRLGTGDDWGRKVGERAVRTAGPANSRPADASGPTIVGQRSDVATDVPVPTPPFWGSRVVRGVPLDDVAALLNKRALFRSQWGFGREDIPAGEAALRQMLAMARAESLLTPMAVYGYFSCSSDGNDVIVYEAPNSDTIAVRFSFPRQTRGRLLSIADFFRPLDSGERDVIAFHCVTMGSRVSERAAQLFADNHYTDYLYLHGFGVEMAEAMAELWHGRIRSELGIDAGDAHTPEELFRQGYRGSRYSFGYAACPDLEARKPLFDLIDPTRIGLELSEEFQLHPEQSTDALIVHHPEAKYFNAR